jgi:hypothetical protein
MKQTLKNLDTFQIVGFLISAIVSIGFLLAEQKAITSVILGFVLAALTQGFDIQKRLTASEERLLLASALSKDLYLDEWLLDHIQQIVDDYQAIKTIWFRMFKQRGDEAITQCREIIHGLKEGEWIDVSGRTGLQKEETLKYATRKGGTLKAVAAVDPLYWRSLEASIWVRANAAAVNDGVKVTRIFNYPKETLQGMIDVMEKQRNLGIEVYVAPAEDVPSEYIADYIIFDDRIVHTIERVGKQNRISIINVEYWISQFEGLLQFANKLDDVIDELKSNNN